MYLFLLYLLFFNKPSTHHRTLNSANSIIFLSFICLYYISDMSSVSSSMLSLCHVIHWEFRRTHSTVYHKQTKHHALDQSTEQHVHLFLWIFSWDYSTYMLLFLRPARILELNSAGLLDPKIQVIIWHKRTTALYILESNLFLSAI